MDKLSELFTKYPWLILGLVAVVAFLAFRSSSSTSDGVTTIGGGVRSLPVDQGTVDIETARLSAGTAGINSVASLLLGEHQSSDSLVASLAQTGAARDVAITESNNNLTQSQIAAAYTASMNADNNATAVKQSTIAAGVQTSAQQTQKDIERARDNTSITGQVIGFVGNALSFLSHFW